MRADEWLAKARLLEIGETLQVSCVSSGEAHSILAKVNNILRVSSFPDYSLLGYVKPQHLNDGSKGWWLCLVKVQRTDKGYIKKADGTITVEGDSYITREAQRIFQLAISDGKSEEELISLAVNELEVRYVKELLKTKRPHIIEGIGD